MPVGLVFPDGFVLLVVDEVGFWFCVEVPFEVWFVELLFPVLPFPLPGDDGVDVVTIGVVDDDVQRMVVLDWLVVLVVFSLPPTASM